MINNWRKGSLKNLDRVNLSNLHFKKQDNQDIYRNWNNWLQNNNLRNDLYLISINYHTSFA